MASDDPMGIVIAVTAFVANANLAGMLVTWVACLCCPGKWWACRRRCLQCLFRKIYPETLVTQASGFPWWLTVFFFANPMTGIVTWYRVALLGVPNPGTNLIALSVAVSALILALGLIVFQNTQARFGDERRTNMCCGTWRRVTTTSAFGECTKNSSPPALREPDDTNIHCQNLLFEG